MTNHTTQAFVAQAGCGIWMSLAEVFARGPSWELLPPLLIALTGLVGAVNSYRSGQQSRRHAEEEHRLKMHRLAWGLEVEGLDSSRN